MAKGIWLGVANPTDSLELNKYYSIEIGVIPVKVKDNIAMQGVPQVRVEPRIAIHILNSPILVTYNNIDEIVADWEFHADDYDFADIEEGKIIDEKDTKENNKESKLILLK